jgi:Papain family cysteine protease
MAIDAEEFGRRLKAKKLAEPKDERYLRLSDNSTLIKVQGGQLIPLLPREADLTLTNEELSIADALAPYWQDDRPVCGAAEHSFSLRALQSPVGNQHNRSTCVAFASLAALEYDLRPGDPDINLSEQYANWLFMKRESADLCREWLQTKRAAEHLRSYGVCRESEWGYEDSAGTRCRRDRDAPEGALSTATVGIDDYRMLGGGLKGPRVGNSDYLECILSRGRPIVMALGVAIGRIDNSQDGYDVLLSRRPDVPRTSEGGHAMLLVGYDKGRELFEFKNSWGDTSDDHGYTWLKYDVVREYARYGFIVTAVDENKPIRPELGVQALDLVNNRLNQLEERLYRNAPESVVSIRLPLLERTEATAGVFFNVKRVGEGIEGIEDGPISNDRFVLPAVIEAKAGKSGFGHLVFTASDQEGREISGIAPFVVAVNVDRV